MSTKHTYAPRNPKLTLLVGPAGSGKTHACLENLSQSLQTSPDPLANDLLLILPTVEHRERVIDLLLRHSRAGFFGRVVTTFDESLHSLLKLGGLHFASDVTRYLILRDLIQSMKFEYFKEAARTKGFIELLSHSIAELKESLVSASDFKQLFLPRLGKEFPSSEAKYRELADLYLAYDAELERAGLKDRQDALFLLEEGLQRGEWQAPHFRHVWIDGFFDFSKLQFAFIRFLARHSDQVTVTLTLDPVSRRSDLFRISEETKAELLKIGFGITVHQSENQRAQNEALVHLEQNLFLEKEPLQIEPTRAIQVFEATGLLGELEMVAREIKRIIREQEIHYSDIALLFRRVGPYCTIVQSVFSRFQIPFEIHEREELRLNPLARALVNLFRIFLDGWRRDDLLNFLKFQAAGEEEQKSVCQVELEALKQGISKGREHWLEAFRFPPFLVLQKLEERFLAAQTLDALIQITKEALRAFGINRLPEDLTERNRLNHAALKRIDLLFDEMKRKYLGRSFDFQSFSDVFIRLIEVDLFSFHNRDKNKVQIYNVSLARQKEYKVVFMPGLLEKNFPMQIREDPIFSDEERRVINEKGEILKERLPRQAVERFFFYSGVTRAREQLILSYPRFDLEGKEALPSFYVDEVRTLFKEEIPTQKQTVRDVLPDLRLAAIPEELVAHAIYGFWQIPEARQSKKNGQILTALYNTLVRDPLFQKSVQALLMPIEGKISDKKVKAVFRPKGDVYTPTRLEEYAECPYRYFADQVLGLESIDERIDLRVVGSILHEALERFHEWAKTQGIEHVTIQSAKQKCLGYLEQAFKENPLLGDRWYRIELKKYEIREIINRILDQEIARKKPPLPNLRPEYFEYKFGFDPSNYLVVESEVGPIKFRGKIDRIDIDESGKFGLVIDYKTGKEFKNRDLKNGTELQLPLYILALQKILKLEPLGAHLYSLSATSSSGFHHEENLERAGIDTKKRNKLSVQEWDALFERLVLFITEYVRGIRNAEIPVRPRDCVRFCPYSSICRIEKWRLDYIYREIGEEDRKLWKEKVKT